MDIKNGLTIIDDEYINLTQKFDPSDSTMESSYTLKPRAAPVHLKRKAEVRNNTTKEMSEKKKEEKSQKKKAVKSDVLVERKADYKVVFIVTLVLCLLIWIIISKYSFIKKL